jgi:excisionase family DNA binding protein
LETLLPTSDAAARLGVAAKTVRDWLETGRLRGRRIGNRWVVEEHSVAAMERQQASAARPYVRDWR